MYNVREIYCYSNAIQKFNFLTRQINAFKLSLAIWNFFTSSKENDKQETVIVKIMFKIKYFVI
jgi:hypothetical protein